MWEPASTKVGCKLKLEDNCELNIRTNDNTIVWSSATANLGLRNCTLKVGNDGSFAIRNSNDNPIWSLLSMSCPADYILIHDNECAKYETEQYFEEIGGVKQSSKAFKENLGNGFTK